MIQLHGLDRADAACTLYYDETNNARRLHVTPEGFNVRDPGCFVLGGVGHPGAPRPLDLASLYKTVRLQPTAKELKLEHLGSGDFLKLIGSQKVAAYLAWLKDQDLLVHYSVVDPTALDAYLAVDDEVGQRLIAIAEQTDDRALGQVALGVAAKRCGLSTRQKIWAMSLADPARWVRMDAIDALTWADVVESEILDLVTPELLLRLAPPLAASATMLLGVHGQVGAVVHAMERVAHSNKHRALLLLGAWALSERDRVAAAGLLDLLDAGHPGRRLLDLPAGERLPASILDDLGHVRIRRAVRGWLKDVIEGA